MANSIPKNRVQNNLLCKPSLLAEKMADRRKILRRGSATDYFGQKSDDLARENFLRLRLASDLEFSRKMMANKMANKLGWNSVK